MFVSEHIVDIAVDISRHLNAMRTPLDHIDIYAKNNVMSQILPWRGSGKAGVM